MRVVFVGADGLSVATAELLIARGHEVVIIDRDKDVIEALSDHLDCGFVHGDGSRPAILREASPRGSDLLLCLTGDDQTNILASLVGRSLGFERVVTKIEDQELEHICLELGLEDTIVPSRTIARYLADTAEGLNLLELSAMVKHGARVLSFVVREDQQHPIEELELPERSRVVCLYRAERFVLPAPDTRLRTDDELVIIAHIDEVPRVLALFQAD